MQTIEGMTTHSKAGFLSVVDAIGALKNILARSQVTFPDLDTPYSSLPNTVHKDMSIGTIITERQQQLDAVLHEISGLETIMDSIENLHQQLVLKQAEITQSLNLHKGLASPLWRLPTEVLSQIFHLCLPEFDKFEVPSELDAPVLLTRVCRQWREVVMGIPSLWSRPSLLFCPGDQWERQSFCYGSWLKRSRGRPLSLTLWNDCPYDSTKIRSLLQPYTHQISSLCIHFSQQRPEDQPELLLDDFPALRELTILTMDLPSIVYSIAQLPSTVTNLKILRSCFTNATLPFHWNPVWTHLTTVVMEMLQPHTSIHLLKLCPNLSSAMIGIAFGSSPPVLQPFTHTNLQSLSIAFKYTSHLSSLLSGVSLPNLRVLEISSSSKWPHNEFKAFLTRSMCVLESLVFSGPVAMKDAHRAEYVALIPSLEVVVDPGRLNYYDL